MSHFFASHVLSLPEAKRAKFCLQPFFFFPSSESHKLILAANASLSKRKGTITDHLHISDSHHLSPLHHLEFKFFWLLLHRR